MINLPYHDRIPLDENERQFIEMDIKETPTGIKFSLVLIRDKKRLVGFDNHEGRDPHKHIKNKVYPYDFETADKLIQDFYDEIERFISVP